MRRFSEAFGSAFGYVLGVGMALVIVAICMGAIALLVGVHLDRLRQEGAGE